MRKRWTAGAPCPKCKEPIWAESDRYKPGRSICHPCGKIENNNQRVAARAKTAQPCRVCNCVLVGNDKRHAACKPCREAGATAANAARTCPCGASIAHRSRNARFCDKCSSRQRANGAMAGGVAARRKVTKERLPEVVARPVAQAWPGLRGPGGEWEHGVTSVQGWATLYRGRA
jgi:hypothetical protein